MIGLMMLAAATQMSLARLQSLCVSDRERCSLYILGVTEGVRLGAGVAKDAGHFCVPDDVTENELVEVVSRMAKADLAAFPDDRTLPASSFIGAALLKNYPCQR